MQKKRFWCEYEVPLGTYMFFEDDQAPESKDPLFDKVPEKNLKYVCKTRKYVKMEHAYVTEKGGPSAKNEFEQSAIPVPKVEFKNLHEAIDSFKTIRCQEPKINPVDSDQISSKPSLHYSS
ncbi:uncharacterized protein LOC114359132 isoform X2 [Ostrinia furnacalis]|uniref:uncharacterized protein LOC114359132 isoform X2 n=1 Tax=Ostrinia furnacalis TaxID=93504 RepID=UPI00103B057F|nr:uncharacterized protein LOC114359132 isoform X2 [Ostrinia furnacalis]